LSRQRPPIRQPPSPTDLPQKATTWNGEPLHKHRAHGVKHPFPWRGVGYLRLRSYKLTVPAGAYIPSAMPGTADVTFKMKKVCLKGSMCGGGCCNGMKWGIVKHVSHHLRLM